MKKFLTFRVIVLYSISSIVSAKLTAGREENPHHIPPAWISCAVSVFFLPLFFEPTTLSGTETLGGTMILRILYPKERTLYFRRVREGYLQVVYYNHGGTHPGYCLPAGGDVKVDGVKHNYLRLQTIRRILRCCPRRCTHT